MPASSILCYPLETATGLNEEGIKEYLFAFVKENLRSFDIFLTDKTKEPVLFPSKFPRALDQKMVEYFLMLEQSKSALFNTLQDIIAGSIISVSLFSNGIAEIGRKFEHMTVYLDSNFLFSLLELHHKDQCNPVIELFKMMKEARVFTFKVFDFTLDEIRSVLKGYRNGEHVYLSFIQTDSIYSSLKQKGWTSAEVISYIAKIEETLAVMDIAIAITGINLDTYASDETIKEDLLLYKEYKGHRGVNHDLAAIDKVKALRSLRTTRLENAKVIFLTSDIRLARFNYNRFHKSSGTVNEVIPDRLLTNIIWLKKPKASQNITMSSLISAFRSGKLIHHEVWDKFVERLKTLRDSNKIEDADVAALLYDKHLQEDLLDFRNERDKVDDAFIFGNIEEAKKREAKAKKLEVIRDIANQKSFEAEISLKLNEIEGLQEVISRTNEEKAEALDSNTEISEAVLRTITARKAGLSLKAEQGSKLFIILLKVLFFLICAVFFRLIYILFTSEWRSLEPRVAVLQFVLPIIIWILAENVPSYRRVFTTLFDWRYNKLYNMYSLGDEDLLDLENKLQK